MIFSGDLKIKTRSLNALQHIDKICLPKLNERVNANHRSCIELPVDLSGRLCKKLVWLIDAHKRESYNKVMIHIGYIMLTHTCITLYVNT